MPSNFDFYFQCTNPECLIKLSSQVICQRPMRLSRKTTKEEINEYMKQYAKPCPACRQTVEWKYLTKGDF